ncbi:MAG: efflux RND transporter periplasmic adaptor subunit [Woeseia sp.]
MNRSKVLLTGAIVGLAMLLAVVVVFDWSADSRPSESHAHDEAEPEAGPHDGRLLEEGDFSLEVTIFENGVPPEFRLYAYRNGQPLAPDDISAGIELQRLGGSRDAFSFSPENDYLRGNGTVREPHSFDVHVTATASGREHRWTYESHEGRTQISHRAAEASGIEVELAGPATIVETIDLTGTIQTDPGRVSRVRPRFAGIVTDVHRTIGDYVQAGESLASVETNESLRSIPVTAPISGLIVQRDVQAGQVTGTEPLFVIADLSEVSAQLDVFGNQTAAVRPGQRAEIRTLDGADLAGTIDWISPLVSHGSQSVRARVALANSDQRLSPGQFIQASVIAAEVEVPLAVKRSALQRFRDFEVVFARVDDVYEVRMLELGRMDSEHAEVLSGLDVGETYVTGNSYLIKADIEKSGASHDH